MDQFVWPIEIMTSFPIIKLHAMWLVQTRQLEEVTIQSISPFHLAKKKNLKSGPCATLPCLSPLSLFSL